MKPCCWQDTATGHSSQGTYGAAGYRAAGDGSWLAHLSSAWPPREGWVPLLESTSPAGYLLARLVSHRSQPARWEDRETTTCGRRWVQGRHHQCNQLLPGPFQEGNPVLVLCSSILQPAHPYRDQKLGASLKRTPRAGLPDVSKAHFTTL